MKRLTIGRVVCASIAFAIVLTATWEICLLLPGSEPLQIVEGHATERAGDRVAMRSNTAASTPRSVDQPRRQISSRNIAGRFILHVRAESEAGPVLHGVSVFALPMRRIRMQWREDGAHWSEQVLHSGTQFAASENGDVQMPTLECDTVFVAWHDEMYGWKAVSARGPVREADLVLRPDRTLRLCVENQRGDPVAGIPIKIQQLLSHESEPLERRKDSLRRYSDRNGEILIRHLQSYTDDPVLATSLDRFGRFIATLDICMEQTVQRRFHANQLTDVPITLVVPGTASVFVRLRVSDHEDYFHRASGHLSFDNGDNSIARPSLPVDTGLRFPFVSLGSRVQISLQIADHKFNLETFDVQRPRLPDLDVVVDVPLLREFGILTGRLVDSSKSPLSDVRATFILSDHNSAVDRQELVSDHDGHFQFCFKSAQLQPPYRFDIELATSGAQLGNSTPLTNLVPHRITTLGNLTLQPLQRLAHGRILNDLGDPIPDATIRLQQAYRSARKQTTRWRYNRSAPAKSNRDGRYEILDRQSSPQTRLHAAAAGHESITEALPQSGALDLVLQRLGHLQITFVLPPSIGEESLEVELVSTTPIFDQRKPQRLRLPMQRHFAVPVIKPGIYTLRIYRHGFVDPIREIHNIEVAPGSSLQTRPLSVDLNGWLRRDLPRHTGH